MKLVLKGIWAIPVIASILILGSLGLIQDAHAASIIFTTDTTITSDATIGGGDTWQINPGVTLTINPGVTITNFGTITNLGTIINAGTIDNRGTIINDFSKTIILVDGGSITDLFGFGTIINSGFGAAIVGASCGSGTTLSESTNECEADVTQAQLDTALDALDQALDDLGDALADLAAALVTIMGLEELVEELGQPGPPIANQGNGQGVPAQGKNKP